MTVKIMAWNKAGEATIFSGRQYSEVERQADQWGAVRYEDALGGIFRQIGGDWIFITQRTPNDP